MKRYELTYTRQDNDDTTLYRIRACVSFDTAYKHVEASAWGGWIASEDNLPQDATAWVDNEAVVRDRAMVTGRAHVAGQARISADAIIDEDALVKDKAVVTDRAIIRGAARVENYARIEDSALVFERAHIWDCALVNGEAHVGGRALVNGDAHVGGCAYVGGDILLPDFASVGRDAYIVQPNSALCIYAGGQEDSRWDFPGFTFYVGRSGALYVGNVQYDMPLDQFELFVREDAALPRMRRMSEYICVARHYLSIK